MAKKKNEIIIQINECTKGYIEKEFTYNKILFNCIFYENGLKINFKTVKKTDIERILYLIYVKEVIKKCILLYYCINKKIINCDYVNISLCKENKEIENKKINYKIKSIVRIIPNFDYTKIIEELLEKTRSKYSKKIIAWQHYAMALSKNDTFEKFSYLWMSFNAFYNQFVKTREKFKLLEVLRKYYEINNVLGKNERDKFFAKFNSSVEIEKQIEYIINKFPRYTGMDQKKLEGFKLIEMSYYLRCNYFHGNKSIPLVILKDDDEINKLNWCTQNLEAFLNQHIFDTVTG